MGPWEHRSYLLPWREAGAAVVSVRADPRTGRTDLEHLAQVTGSLTRLSAIMIFPTGRSLPRLREAP